MQLHPYSIQTVPHLDIPDTLESADHPEAELADHPEAELDKLLILLILLLLEVRLISHCSKIESSRVCAHKLQIKT